jgi:hypothetical protein
VPPVSLAALQFKLTCVLPAAPAVKLLGVVNVGVAVVAVAALEYGLTFPPESTALTR